MSHRIRLHGPWEVRPRNPAVPSGRMTLPGMLRDGGWEGFVGHVLFLRKFGQPTNLDATEQVWLVFDGIEGSADIRMNGELLGRLSGTGRFEIRARLAMRNELAVEIDASDDRCGIVGDVALEIMANVAA